MAGRAGANEADRNGRVSVDRSMGIVAGRRVVFTPSGFRSTLLCDPFPPLPLRRVYADRCDRKSARPADVAFV